MKIDINRNKQSKYYQEGGFIATTAVILAGVALAGAGVAAYGSLQSAQAQKASANFNAKVAENNATAAQQQAAQDASNQQRRITRLRGTQIANFAAAGVGDSGTATDIGYDTRVQGQLERLTTLYKGQVEGNAYQSQASLNRYQGSAAETAGYFNAGASILSGVGNAGFTAASVSNNPRFK